MRVERAKRATPEFYTLALEIDSKFPSRKKLVETYNVGSFFNVIQAIAS